MTRHHIHVWPCTRLAGRLLLRNWLAITLEVAARTAADAARVR